MANSVKKFYLFRHGETFVTRGDRLYYGTKVFSADILDQGKPALTKMGKYLKKIPTDFNVSSQIKRCRQTVQIISKNSDKEFAFDWRLNEVFFELPFFFKMRVRSLLNSIKKSEFQSIAICTHAAVINRLIRAINPKAFGTLLKKDPDPRPPLQIEVSKQPIIENKLNFKKYLSPGVLLILTENSVQEINFNTSDESSP